MLALALPACAVARTSAVTRIALLAPFEGRYREIGYNALYAARLALRDQGDESVVLLAIDDGGSAASAADRAHALAADPLVRGAIVMGYAAADPVVQEAFGDVPAIIVANWTDSRAGDSVFLLAICFPDIPLVSADAAARLESPFIGGDAFALESVRERRASLGNFMILSSGSPPNASFIERYQAGDQFSPAPNLWATLVYDAAAMLTAVSPAGDRAAVAHQLAGTEHVGLNGEIAFNADGCWSSAPSHYYRYEGGDLVRVDDAVE